MIDKRIFKKQIKAYLTIVKDESDHIYFDYIDLIDTWIKCYVEKRKIEKIINEEYRKIIFKT